MIPKATTSGRLCVVKDQVIMDQGVVPQFSSVAQSCPTLCDPMIRSMPGLPVITNSQSSLRLTSTESVMPFRHLILCRPLLLLPPTPPSIRVSQLFAGGGQSNAISALALPMSQLFARGGQSNAISALASFLSKKSQG